MALTPAEANFIFQNTLGCRYGVTTDGAAYGFMDLVGEGADGGPDIIPVPTLVAWLQDPAAPEFEPRWHDRLWNTCAMIVGLSAAGRVILVTKASPTAERYDVGDQIGRGDGYTFRKCNRLPSTSQILAAIDYGQGRAAPERADITPLPEGVDLGGREDTVKDLYDRILREIRKLAKTPGA